MILEKPQHFAQTSVYGYKMGFEYVAYFNICKNNDDLHVEVVKLDYGLAKQMISKAERIITSDKAPLRISDNPTFYKCKSSWCNFHDICHKGALPEKNCRSCKSAVPIDNAEWHCNLHGQTIPKEAIPKACDSYKAITCNV